jgi:hypothetical protein
VRDRISQSGLGPGCGCLWTPKESPASRAHCMRAFLIGVAHAVPCCSLGTAPCAADRTVNCTGEERRSAPQVSLREYCKMGYPHDGAASVQRASRVFGSRAYTVARTGKGVCKRACACVCMPCATWLRMPARLAALCSFFTRPHLRHCYFNSVSRKHKDEHKQTNKRGASQSVAPVDAFTHGRAAGF